MNIKDLSIVLADSSVNFKMRSNYFVEIVANTDLLADDSDRKKHIEQGLLLKPNVLYKFVFVADNFSFTENEELSVILWFYMYLIFYTIVLDVILSHIRLHASSWLSVWTNIRSSSQ